MPRADLVVRYIRGSYVVIRYDEDVAQEWVFAPDKIKYDLESEARYRLVTLAKTMLLMSGTLRLPARGCRCSLPGPDRVS